MPDLDLIRWCNENPGRNPHTGRTREEEHDFQIAEKSKGKPLSEILDSRNAEHIVIAPVSALLYNRVRSIPTHSRDFSKVLLVNCEDRIMDWCSWNNKKEGLEEVEENVKLGVAELTERWIEIG